MPCKAVSQVQASLNYLYQLCDLLIKSSLTIHVLTKTNNALDRALGQALNLKFTILIWLISNPFSQWSLVRTIPHARDLIEQSSIE